MPDTSVEKREMRLIARLGLICLTLLLSLAWAPGLLAGVTYTYDDRNRLVTANYNDHIVITYTYDDIGNRLTRQVANSDDTDGDMLDDALETAAGSCTLYNNPDTDGDGILDGLEDANRNGVWDEGVETNPCVADTDGDGLDDSEEDINRNGIFGEDGETSPLDPDMDDDGLPDGWEVAYGLDPFDGSNANQDADFDRMTALEEYANGTDPTVYHIFTGVIYVDAVAAGDDNGTSWNNAFISLQDALGAGATINGDTPIWVVAGTYYPDEGTGQTDDDWTATFSIPDGVQVYGGFAGTEIDLAERDWGTNVTILSGDLDQDDEAEDWDNAATVVTFDGVSEQTVLDGFTITAGYAPGYGELISPEMFGGGIYNYAYGNGVVSNPQIVNCTISGNEATYGSGMYNGAENDGTANPQIVNCTFSGNTGDYGGGLYNGGYYSAYGEPGGTSSPTLTGCTFTGNAGSYYGGGLYNIGRDEDGASEPVLENCTFSGNSGGDGGGIFNLAEENGFSNLRLRGCVISGNSADENGGGIASWDLDSMGSASVCQTSLVNCSISGNSAAYGDGGGIYNYAGSYNSGVCSVMLTNCLISGNSAAYDGGGILNSVDGGTISSVLTNCTISGNSADYGGGMLSEFLGDSANGDSCELALVNCILWNDAATTDADEVYNDNVTPVWAYCDIAGSGGSTDWDDSLGEDNGNNIDANPLFMSAVDPASAPTTLGDWRLTPGSPCLDAGGASNTESFDLDGEDRIQNGTIDLGAYEGGQGEADTDNDGLPDDWEVAYGLDPLDGTDATADGDYDRLTNYEEYAGGTDPTVYQIFTGTIYVDAGADGADNGTSWADAFISLQDALGAAATVDGTAPVWVVAGTYCPDEGTAQTADDRDASFTIASGVQVYGGFVGTESTLDERDWENNVTILSGDLLQDDAVGGDNSENAYHVVWFYNVGDQTILDGFTISAGNADGSGDSIPYGGGIYNGSNCAGNTSNPQINNCTVSNNSGYDGGGGMYNESYDGGTSSPAFSDCVFSNNMGSDGGGIANYGENGVCTPSFTDCVFSDNYAASGGGMSNRAYGDGISSPTLVNCVFNSNSADEYGGGIENYSEGGAVNPVLTNCILNGNNAGYTGGGMDIYSEDDGVVNTVLVNCTIAGNNATDEGGGICNYADSGTASLSLVNSIVWNNDAASSSEVYLNSYAEVSFSYCDVKGSGGSAAWDTTLGTDGGNNIDADPLFVDESSGDLRLLAGSPCLDMGDNTANAESFDLDGEDRIQDGTIDLGAYEGAEGDADTDNDYLPDIIEDAYCTDTYDADTDNDGIGDGVEDANHDGVWDEGVETNPCNADTDGDGLNDGDEVLTYFTDPTLADTDNDGLADGDELAYWGTDWATDYDGDAGTYANNLLDPDSDNDGLTDGDEVNTYNTNPAVANNLSPELTATDPADGSTVEGELNQIMITLSDEDGVDLSSISAFAVTGLANGDVPGSIASAIKYPLSDGWKRVKVTIDHTQVASDLTDFPVYLDLSTFGTDFWDDVADGGGDIRITTADLVTELPREVVSCDQSTDIGEVHFKADLLSSSEDTVFYVHYGNPACDPLESEFAAENVWGSDYRLVSHDGGLTDSSANENNGVEYNGVVGGSVAGQMGVATGFDGANDYISIADDSSLDLSGNMALSFWINAAYTGNVVAMEKGKNNQLMLQPSASGLFYLDASAAAPIDDRDLILNSTWQLVHIIYDGTSKHLCVDGSEIDAAVGAAPSPNDNPFYLGSRAGAYAFSGVFDEVRLRNTDASADWITTEYVNQSDPASFYSVETVTEETVATFVFTPDSVPLSSDDYTVTFTAADDLGNSGSYSFGFTVDLLPGDADDDYLPDTVEVDDTDCPYLNDADSDDDGILDGVEDANHDGVWDVGVETDPCNADTDGDGIDDGVEDANQNGFVDAGETDPALTDTDGDGISDGVEDANQNGIFDADETDPCDADTDGDGLSDGEEDVNFNGVVDAGETDPTDATSNAAPELTETDPADGSTVEGELDQIMITLSDADGVDLSSISTFAVTGTTNGDIPGSIDSNKYPLADGWSRIKVTIDHTQVTSDLTDFPVYLGLSTFGTDFWATVADGGGDIRITKADLVTELPREVVSCDTTAQTGEVHFKADLLSSSEDTVFYVHYGKSGETDYAADADYGAQNVWNSNYQLASHNGGGIDSTSNGNDGTVAGDPTATDGRFGAGYNLDGYEDGFVLSNQTIKDVFDGSFCVSMWFNPNGNAPPGYFEWLFAKEYTSHTSPYYQFDIKRFNNNTLQATMWRSDTYSSYLRVEEATALVQNGVWNCVSAIYNQSDNKLELYVNGVFIGSDDTSEGSYVNYDTDAKIGGNANFASTTYDFNGKVDELRIASTSLSADWISAEYANQSAPSSFYSVETITEEDTTAVTFAFTPDSVPLSSDNYTVSFTAADALGNSDEYTFGFTVDLLPGDADNDYLPDNIEVDDTNCPYLNDADSDDDGILDGVEDADHDGVVSAGESDPCDADTDDDGILDGVEDANQDGVVDANETDPYNADTDGDGIQDGTEWGYTLDEIGSDTDTSVFIPDGDPTTTTDPLSIDTDGDHVSDGDEDRNANGMVDEGESDPDAADLVDVTAGQIIYASSEYNTTGAKEHVFDDDEATYWLPASYPVADNEWISVDFLGSRYAVNVVRIKGSDSVNYSPGDFIIQGSNEISPEASKTSSDWTTLTDVLTYTGVGEWQSFVFTNDTFYRHIRIWFVSGGSSGYVMLVREIEMFGEKEVYDDSDGDNIPDTIESSGCTDAAIADTDGDGLLDGEEDVDYNGILTTGETDPCDADTDDDGLLDGDEVNVYGTDPLVTDSDGDGIQDGTELGYGLSNIGADTDTAVFVPDEDPSTTTDPLSTDTDGDHVPDGDEDRNYNGMVDEGESDPDAADLVDVTADQIVYASSEYNTTGAKENAFDDDEATYWLPVSAPVNDNEWISVDFLGSRYAVNVVRIKGNSVVSNPGDFIIQGSNEISPEESKTSSDWTTLTDVLTYTGVDEWQSFAFTNDAFYRHTRIWFVSGGSSSSVMVVREIEMFGMEEAE